MKKLISIAMLFAVSTAFVMAHCEIPCGIYGDKMRVEELREHFQTVEKSMRKVEELSAKKDKNYNQLVRWVNNKELHANKIQEIVYQYFMNQRIKPVESPKDKGWDKYVKQTTLLHKMLVQAMKCKQTTDKEHVEELRSLLDRFVKVYFGESLKESEESGHEHMRKK